MALEITNICRICLALEWNLLSIYKTKGFSNVQNVSDMLTEITDIPPEKSDGFPENVCLECIREINRCYSFKLKCEQSYSILKQILLGNLEETQELQKSEKHKSDSDLEIPNQTIISNFFSSAQTDISKPETSYNEVCSNNQNKRSAAEKVSRDTEREELMSSDSFQMMITKIIFEDDEVEFIDISGPTKLQSRESAKPNKKSEVIKNDVIQNDQAEDRSDNSDYKEENANDNRSNTKNEVLLESPLLNGNEDKGEYEKHLSREALNFNSDIILRNSPIQEKPSFSCSNCGKVFNLLSVLRKHMLIHSEERPYSYKYCGKIFSRKSTHKLDELQHDEVEFLDISDPTKLQSIESAKSYKESEVIKNDVIQIDQADDHLDNSDYQEENSNDNKSNTKKEALLESPLLNGNEDRGEYEINLSREAINFKSDIIPRNSPIKKESSFLCSNCGKVFNTLSNLYKHIVMHSEERPFSCKYCGKTFPRKSSHKQHELRHSKNKPFQCEECENSYICSRELKAHLLVHTNEYPYVCAICGRKFRYPNILKTHIRTHTGEKPYVCAHCPKKYSHLTTLTDHHSRHSEKELSITEFNKCKYCKPFLIKNNQK